jgi:tRNA(Arg) A34 adenosine deaminase TadA
MFDELDLSAVRSTDAAKMELAVELARRNVRYGGGPFGAVVFDADRGAVVSVGANMVVGQGCSLLHAEIVALTFAEASLGTYSLRGGNHELVTSSEPCVQCLGAVYWSGIRRLVCGARVADAEAAGFDEGPRSSDWVGELGRRGIAVELEVLLDRARGVLRDYTAQGGVVYNA